MNEALCCGPLAAHGSPFFHSECTVTGYMAIKLEITLPSLQMQPSDIVLLSGEWVAGMGTFSGFRPKDPPLKMGHRSAHELALHVDGLCHVRKVEKQGRRNLGPWISARNMTALQAWNARRAICAINKVVSPIIRCILGSLCCSSFTFIVGFVIIGTSTVCSTVLSALHWIVSLMSFWGRYCYSHFPDEETQTWRVEWFSQEQCNDQQHDWMMQSSNA